MLDELDAFEFVLAESLGLTLGQVRALPNAEVEQWRAFHKYRSAMQEFEAQKRMRRAKRGH